ncbi:MAG: BON domain-containing protein [bacterium]
MRTRIKTLGFSLLLLPALTGAALPPAPYAQNHPAIMRLSPHYRTRAFNMHLFIRFFLLAISPFLLSASTLPAQDAAAKLKAKIMTALERSYVTSAFKIAVTTPGHVVIDGEVPSYWDKQNVFAIVARVPGVKDISNRVSVQTAVVPDPIIKVELDEYLKRIRAIKDPGKIIVEMVDGGMTLRGTVNFPHEKALAEEIAAWHRSVKSIDNQIRVLSLDKTVSDASLTRVIKDMLSCDFPCEEKTVQIKIEKGRVSLSGTVSRLWAKLEIEKAVQSTAGMRQVENRIEVISE